MKNLNINLKRYRLITILFALFTSVQLTLAINSDEVINKDIDITARYQMDPIVGMRLWVDGVVSADNTINCGKHDNTIKSGLYRSFCTSAAQTSTSDAIYKTSQNYIRKTALEIYDQRSLGGIKSVELQVSITTFDGVGNLLSNIHLPTNMYISDNLNEVIYNDSNTYHNDLNTASITKLISTTGSYAEVTQTKTKTEMLNIQGLQTTSGQSAYIPFGFFGWHWANLADDVYEARYKGHYRAKITFVLSNPSWNGI
ncbi:hypothetical protein [Cysteiniphilum sp. QT6929]|uniref:hypothetical protein n=1 Tax=Cysteiniphilum sp. QT6929 TaxID=2975055 RepID=UPI0024B384EE|nr:hypothetical protein [Cysteiniphilum sp. QT6929]WHN66475.1 hypothetical protein NYP54_04410 [Cysteiniphilum sp. QT6929]